MFAMVLAINFDIVNMLVPEIINMNVVMFMGISGCKIFIFFLLSCYFHPTFLGQYNWQFLD